LEGKISWEHANILKAYHSIQAWFPFIFGCSKNLMHTLQNNVHMLEFPYFVMGSHLGANGTGHTSPLWRICTLLFIKP
jgi:hypothetical protein